MSLDNSSVSFSKNVTISVTQPQKQVIEHPIETDKTLQIVSGPGAGKTTTLVYKIAYMIGTLGINPDDILILTMTNRAVDNFKNSLLEILKNQNLVNGLNVHTFHGFSHKLLIEVDQTFKNREILENSGWELLNNLIDNKKLSKTRLERITRDLRKFEDLNDVDIEHICKTHLISKKVAEQLIQFLSDLKVLTHTEILTKAKSLLSNNPSLLGHKITIIDEFQDMYDELTELVGLVSTNSHLIIAGDPNQSIYGFLGSSPDNRKTLVSLKPTETIELDHCFRSSLQIIEASKYVLKRPVVQDTEVSTTSNDNKPMLSLFENTTDEAEMISLEILRLIEESNGMIKPRDIVVLSRTNSQLLQVQKALSFYGLKSYKLSSQPSWLSGDLFYLIEYLRILVYPDSSDFAVLSTMGLLPGVGPVAVRKAYQTSLIEGRSVLDVIKDDVRCDKYINTITDVMVHMDFNDTRSIFQSLLRLGNELGLRSKIQKSMKDQTDKMRIKNQLFEFYENLKISKVLKDQHLDKSDSSSIAEVFLNNHMDLLPFSKTANESVKLSTIHSSKGIEFPVVFMLDMKHMNLTDPEERRLAYVGMTRAKSLLYLNFVKTTTFGGNGERKLKEFEEKFNFFQSSNHFQNNTPVINQAFLNNYKPLRNNMKIFQRGMHTLGRFIK